MRARAAAGAWRAVIGLGLALGAGGCSGGQRPSVYPAALYEVDARNTTSIPAERAEVLRGRARAYEQATGNFSAVVSVSMRDLSRDQGFSGNGGIAVRRPDAMRMQMAGPGGVTAVDLLAVGGRYWSRVAGRDWTTGGLADPPAQGFGFPAGRIARVFLGLDWDHATFVADGAMAVARIPAPDGYELVTIDARDGATREVRWFSPEGVETARVRFAEFENEPGAAGGTGGAAGADGGAGGAGGAGARFPRVVLFWQNEPGVTATIHVEHRTLSPELPAETFTPPAS